MSEQTANQPFYDTEMDYKKAQDKTDASIQGKNTPTSESNFRYNENNSNSSIEPHQNASGGQDHQDKDDIASTGQENEKIDYNVSAEQEDVKIDYTLSTGREDEKTGYSAPEGEKIDYAASAEQENKKIDNNSSAGQENKKIDYSSSARQENEKIDYNASTGQEDKKIEYTESVEQKSEKMASFKIHEKEETCVTVIDNDDENSVQEQKSFFMPKGGTIISDDISEDFDPKNPQSSILLSPTSLRNLTRRRVTSNESTNEPREESVRGSHRDDDLQKKPHFQRRKKFNIAKHIISVVFIVLDLIFDWINWAEMNNRGNYTIIAERRLKNIEFTFECETKGENIQLIYLVFTIIATLMTVIQILNITYQIYWEQKGVFISKVLIDETVETFVILFFIEITQIILIMGFNDVCTLDCIIHSREIQIIVNGILSFLKLVWRFFTKFRCCTVRWISYTGSNKVTPGNANSTPGSGRMSPYRNQTAHTREKWKCEQSLKCCTLRCFPSRFDEPESRAHECTCRTCLACEQACKCCTLRCFPTHLEDPKDDVLDCTCGQCLRCEKNCACCILRCFPSHLESPEEDFWSCRCGECLSCEIPCKCFIFRCFPEYLSPSHQDICTCRCGECLSCELPGKCFIARCFPQHLHPSKSNWWECTCGKCLSCELPCKCFIARCFPRHLSPSKTDWWECTCAKCLSCELPCKCFIARCFPEHLSPSEFDWCECTCGDCMKCERNCCCCVLRCFPSLVGSDENCTCIFKECTACEKSFACCQCRCFPSALDPPKDDVCDCTCGKCLSCEKEICCCKVRCCPEYLAEEDWCECLYCKSNSVVPVSTPLQQAPICRPRTPSQQSIRTSTEQPGAICQPIQTCCLCCKNTRSVPVEDPVPTRRLSPTTLIRVPTQQPLITSQPEPYTIVRMPDPPRPSTPPPPLPRRPVCKDGCSTFLRFILGILILLIFVSLLFYTYLEIVQIRFVLFCVVNDTLMNATQVAFVQNYMAVFNV